MKFSETNKQAENEDFFFANVCNQWCLLITLSHIIIRSFSFAGTRIFSVVMLQLLIQTTRWNRAAVIYVEILKSLKREVEIKTKN